jgi:putative ATP-dependent endonuclease of OLD family
MTTVAVPTSGIKLTDVRISNFRSLTNIQVELDHLTVLVGANNAGKTSFLDAMYAAVGAGRKILTHDDVHLAPGEALPPLERKVTIDIRFRPVDDAGAVVDNFPMGSFWTGLWGPGISQDEEFRDVVAFRTTLAWNPIRGEYTLDRKFLRDWRPNTIWLTSEAGDRAVTASQIEAIAMHYIDAKRDLDDDLRKPGSFWRRLTDNLGLSDTDVAAFEATLSGLNGEIVARSEVLQHLRDNLAELNSVVSADSAGVDIAPVARRLRDLSKGVDVTFATAGAQAFPLTRHGMGTRSLASLLVFRAFASWRDALANREGNRVHTLLALEEPESHLHPQAQRSLFARIKSITGQRIVSTHSPYFAGQAKLEELRLFTKQNGITSAARLNMAGLNLDGQRKLEREVIASRGDLLFARALVLFEGETEEQALPLWAELFWGASIHELGFSFVSVGGQNYFPFIWLARSFGIPWFVFSDGEPAAITTLARELGRAGYPSVAAVNGTSELIQLGAASAIEY